MRDVKVALSILSILGCPVKINIMLSKYVLGKKAPSTIFDSVLNMLLVVEKYFNFPEIVFH